jgi:hypothetical protein
MNRGKLRKVYFVCEKRTKYIIVLKVLLKSQFKKTAMEHHFTVGMRQITLMCAIYSNYIIFENNIILFRTAEVLMLPLGQRHDISDGN